MRSDNMNKSTYSPMCDDSTPHSSDTGALTIQQESGLGEVILVKRCVRCEPRTDVAYSANNMLSQYAVKLEASTLYIMAGESET
jgi:hypothetical protein